MCKTKKDQITDMEIEENIINENGNENNTFELEIENGIQQTILENEFSCLRMIACVIVIYQKYDDITDDLNRKFKTQEIIYHNLKRILEYFVQNLDSNFTDIFYKVIDKVIC